MSLVISPIWQVGSGWWYGICWCHVSGRVVIDLERNGDRKGKGGVRG